MKTLTLAFMLGWIFYTGNIFGDGVVPSRPFADLKTCEAARAELADTFYYLDFSPRCYQVAS